jgi:NADP-dependent 3-hydroxy acid dehydrogenase YdfG
MDRDEMSKHLADKVIAVTGAGSGFGKLIAQKCAAGGAKVVGIDINDESIGQVFEDIRAAGLEGVGQVADVTNLAQVKAAVQKAIDTYGSIDVIVNNTGVMPLAYFADHERAWEKWHKAIDINIKGGRNAGQFAENVGNLQSGSLRPEQVDIDSVQYWLITPDDLADAVVHVIDQPWGINLSDVTVRASGENYVY